MVTAATTAGGWVIPPNSSSRASHRPGRVRTNLALTSPRSVLECKILGVAPLTARRRCAITHANSRMAKITSPAMSKPSASMSQK